VNTTLVILSDSWELRVSGRLIERVVYGAGRAEEGSISA
jgi:hypothetical protein